MAEKRIGTKSLALGMVFIILGLVFAGQVSAELLKKHFYGGLYHGK